MTAVTHPSKEQVRLLMQQRRLSRLPPPSPAEIRVRLDWHAVRATKAAA